MPSTSFKAPERFCLFKPLLVSLKRGQDPKSAQVGLYLSGTQVSRLD